MAADEEGLEEESAIAAPDLNDALMAEEPEDAPAGASVEGRDLEALLSDEFDAPEADEVSALEEEAPVAEVEEEAGGALDEFESLLAEEPVEAAVEEEIAAAETEEAPKKERHMMQGIIEVYLQEENYEMALDVCRKAILAGSSSEWLVMQIQELEAIISERMKRDLPRPTEEDIEDAAPEPPTDSEVVKSLLGWLDTVQRRRAKLSADSQRGPSRDIV